MSTVTTDLQVTCEQINTDTGNPQFLVGAYLTNAGRLPTASIFIYEIGNQGDSSSDVFYGICNAIEVTSLPGTREEAIAENNTLYRAGSMTKQYDDVQVAIEAKGLLQSYVDNLVVSYAAFIDEFNSENTEHPSETPTSIQAAQNAYDAAVADREAAEEELASLETQLEEKEAEIAQLTLDINSLQYDVDALGKQLEWATTGRDAFDVLLSSLDSGDVTESAQVGLAALNTLLNGTVEGSLANLIEYKNNNDPNGLSAKTLAKEEAVGDISTPGTASNLTYEITQQEAVVEGKKKIEQEAKDDLDELTS